MFRDITEEIGWEIGRFLESTLPTCWGKPTVGSEIWKNFDVLLPRPPRPPPPHYRHHRGQCTVQVNSHTSSYWRKFKTFPPMLIQCNIQSTVDFTSSPHQGYTKFPLCRGWGEGGEKSGWKRGGGRNVSINPILANMYTKYFDAILY
jgi:hypothetical protein